MARFSRAEISNRCSAEQSACWNLLTVPSPVMSQVRQAPTSAVVNGATPVGLSPSEGADGPETDVPSPDADAPEPAAAEK